MSNSTDIQLTPAEQRELRDILHKAYDPGLIERALHFWLDKKLDHYASPNADMREIVFELIREASGEGWVAELVVSIYCEQPQNVEVQAFFESFRSKILASRPDLAHMVQEVESTSKPASPTQSQTPTQVPSLRQNSPASTERNPSSSTESADILIPAGAFWMGMRPGDFDTLGIDAKEDEIPRYEVYLSAYHIGCYPVTNIEYEAFVQESGHRAPTGWEENEYPEGKSQHPVVNVSWEDAEAYCSWMCDKTGQNYRLPTEAQWEKAARGEDGRFYPWGSEWKSSRLNSREARVNDTMPAGRFSPAGDSPYGVADMAGNVREWCANFYAGDTYQDHKEARDPKGPATGRYRVLRGGSFMDNRIGCRCTTRFAEYPYFYGKYVGFRVVYSKS